MTALTSTDDEKDTSGPHISPAAAAATTNSQSARAMFAMEFTRFEIKSREEHERITQILRQRASEGRRTADLASDESLLALLGKDRCEDFARCMNQSIAKQKEWLTLWRQHQILQILSSKLHPATPQSEIVHDEMDRMLQPLMTNAMLTRFKRHRAKVIRVTHLRHQQQSQQMYADAGQYVENILPFYMRRVRSDRNDPHYRFDRPSISEHVGAYISMRVRGEQITEEDARLRAAHLIRDHGYQAFCAAVRHTTINIVTFQTKSLMPTIYANMVHYQRTFYNKLHGITQQHQQRPLPGGRVRILGRRVDVEEIGSSEEEGASSSDDDDDDNVPPPDQHGHVPSRFLRS